MALIGAGLVVTGVAAWVLLPGLIARGQASISAVPASVNYAAPDLKLTDLHSNPVALSDYRGNVVLVNNWATWCPPCKVEMPTLQAYYEAHRGQNFTIIAIEAGEPVNEVADFVQHYGLTFPVWTDPTLKATVAFRYPGLPSSYVIDANGKVRLAWAGAISREALDQYVTPLLEK